MKTKNRIWPYLFLIMGVILILVNKCEKDEEEEKITDEDGNVYTSVTIGTQVWMVENLKTTKFNDGSSIPNIKDGSAWGSLTTPGYCWYDNDMANKSTYGALYNWYTINNYKLCPDGWHIPTDAEWTILINYLGGENVAGGKLKEVGTSHWISPNNGAADEFGFTALPGGYCADNGDFNYIDHYGVWWCSPECSPATAWDQTLFFDRSGVLSECDDKKYGFSVRCLGD